MRVKYVSRVTSLITCVLYLLCLIYGHNASAESEHSRSDTTPQRIVVFPLYAEEILFELVEPERIVYVGHRFVESGIGVWPTMEACRNVKGECWQKTSEEEILTLRPDLLIFGAALQDEFDEIFPLLAASGIDTLFLDVPESVDAIVDAITLLGDELLSWAECFDKADIGTKHLIVSRLIERVEVRTGYKMHIKFKISLKQFLGQE